jgi:hypothetical protein
MLDPQNRKESPVKSFFARRKAAILGVAVAILSSGAVLAPAQAGTTGPDFTCPSRTVCVYQNNNLTGYHYEFGTKAFGGGTTWHKFSNYGFSPNPGSLNDNSGSVFWVFDAQAGWPDGEYCVNPGKWTISHSYGYFYIQ